MQKCVQFILLVTLLFTSQLVRAQSGLTLTEFAPDISFDLPLDLQNGHDGSGRLFVAEQRGRIFALGADQTKSLFIDLSSKVSSSGSEQGLLGLAFHPNYKSNGHFFVNYTRDSDGFTIISRFSVSNQDPQSADSNSELQLFAIPQPFSNHNGGGLAFGPDGYLYIALGDGGSGGDPLGNAQDRSTLLGKILRIDIDSTASGLNYSIPNDNPYAGNTNGFREEIFAYGFRNPFRISFDSQTGKLFAGDVGQNSREEVDIVRRGGNYGWNIMEGSECFSPSTGCRRRGLRQPLADYSHQLGNVVTGGFVYRGQAIPRLRGFYIFADFGSGRIFKIKSRNRGARLRTFRKTSLNISAFGVDEDQELYAVSYSDGKIYKFTPTQ